MNFSTHTQMACAVALACASTAFADDPVEEWGVAPPFYAVTTVLDSQDNILIGGGSFEVAKLTPGGTILWTTAFDIPGGHDIPRWIAVDGDDNVLLGGYHEGTGGGYLVVKYGPDGNFLWSNVTGFGAGPEARRIAVDEFGAVYVFGETWGGLSGTAATGHDFLTMKIDANGVFQWARIAHGSGSDEPSALAVRDGRVVVTGRTTGPWMTACYDYDGNELWTRLYGDGIWGGNDVAIGSAGEVYVCGYGATNGVQPYVGTILAYDPSGTELWRTFQNGPGGEVDNFLKLGLHADGSLTAVGWASGGVAYGDWSVLRVDSAGHVLWYDQHGGIANNSEWARSVAVGHQGNVYVAGNSGPSCTGLGTETTALAYTESGLRQWEYRVPCGALPYSILVDRSGVLVLSVSNRITRLRETIGTTYCAPAITNSTGSSAELLATGSSIADQRQLVLSARELPPQQFGYFLASQSQGTLPGAGGSQGVLCLSGNIARFVDSVQPSTGTGRMAVAVDLSGIPANPTQPVLAGQTWNYQCWYRDTNPGPTSNFTDAVSVLYQ